MDIKIKDILFLIMMIIKIHFQKVQKNHQESVVYQITLKFISFSLEFRIDMTIDIGNKGVEILNKIRKVNIYY